MTPAWRAHRFGTDSRTARMSDRPLSVLFLSHEYPPQTHWGGVAAFSFSLARILAGAGVQVDVVTCSELARDTTTDEDGIRVHRMRLPSLGRVGGFLRGRYWNSDLRLRVALANMRAIRRLQLRPDIIEVPDWMAEGMLLPAVTRAPTVVHLHSPFEMLASARGLLKTRDVRIAVRMEQACVRRAKAVTAPSMVPLNDSSGRAWFDEGRLFYCGMPLDPQVFLTRPTVGPRTSRVLMVGRLDHLKAPDVLLDAVAKLAPDVPDVELVMVGKSDESGSPTGGDYAQWLRERALLRGVKLRLPGVVEWPKVLELMRTSRVVAVPSRLEVFSMVALEALACATPVVVTQACGVAEWLAELGPGWIVPTGDADALADALRPRLLDEHNASHAGAAGRSLASRRCSPSTIAEERMDIYRSVLRAS